MRAFGPPSAQESTVIESPTLSRMTSVEGACKFMNTPKPGRGSASRLCIILLQYDGCTHSKTESFDSIFHHSMRRPRFLTFLASTGLTAPKVLPVWNSNQTSALRIKKSCLKEKWPVFFGPHIMDLYAVVGVSIHHQHPKITSGGEPVGFGELTRPCVRSGHVSRLFKL